jgi:membrane-associated phospholipid phosphatase
MKGVTVVPALIVGALWLASANTARAQGYDSLAPVAAIVQPVFPSWHADDLAGGNDGASPGSAGARETAPAGAMLRARGAQGSTSVALPELHWSSDGVLGAVGLAGNAIALGLSTTLQPVPEQGLDPSNISWGIDRNTIGNPSTGAYTASNVTVLATLVGTPVFALLTQPGVHGFGNVVRRPFVLYGESLLLAQAFTQLLKPAINRPRPYTYLPASERPTHSGYDVTAEEAFRSMPSGHAATTFAAASYAATDNLLSHPDAGSTEHAAVAAVGGLLAGLTSTLRVEAGQHFPTDIMVGGLIGTASGVSVPLLHSYVFPGGGRAPHPGGHAWLVTAAGYVLGTAAGVGLGSVAY